MARVYMLCEIEFDYEPIVETASMFFEDPTEDDLVTLMVMNLEDEYAHIGLTVDPREVYLK